MGFEPGLHDQRNDEISPELMTPRVIILQNFLVIYSLCFQFQLGVSVISPVYPSHRYLVVFVTGARRGAGTTANVYVVLNGDKRKSDVRVMRDSSRPIFNRDQINAFEVSFSEPLGELQSLQIWHDNTGMWYCIFSWRVWKALLM